MAENQLNEAIIIILNQLKDNVQLAIDEKRKLSQNGLRQLISIKEEVFIDVINICIEYIDLFCQYLVDGQHTKLVYWTMKKHKGGLNPDMILSDLKDIKLFFEGNPS